MESFLHFFPLAGLLAERDYGIYVAAAPFSEPFDASALFGDTLCPLAAPFYYVAVKTLATLGLPAAAAFIFAYVLPAADLLPLAAS